MNLPEIKFSSWYEWNDREHIPNMDKWWVYIIAKFDVLPDGENANYIDENIIYMWETCGQTLRKRLIQFNNSAFLSKDGHSGWWSYNSAYWDIGDNLYVAICPVFDLPEYFIPLYIRYIERKIMLDYAIKHNKATKLNKK